MNNTVNLIPLSPHMAHEAAEAVKKEIKEAYCLDEEALDEALLPVDHRGSIVFDEVKQKIEQVFSTPSWQYALEGVQKTASTRLDTEALNKAAQNIMHGFIGGMTLRNVLGATSDDPFYGSEILYNHNREPVSEALANLYLSHLTNEALSIVRSLGASDAGAMELVDELREHAIHIAQTSHLRTGMGYYLDPNTTPPFDNFEHITSIHLGAMHMMSMEGNHYGQEGEPIHADPAGVAAAQRIIDVQEYAETLTKALADKRREVEQPNWRQQRRIEREFVASANAIG